MKVLNGHIGMIKVWDFDVSANKLENLLIQCKYFTLLSVKALKIYKFKLCTAPDKKLINI